MNIIPLPEPTAVEVPTTAFDDIARNPTPGSGFPFDLHEINDGFQNARAYSSAYFSSIEQVRQRVRHFTDQVIRPQALEIEKRVSRDPKYCAWDVLKKACDHRLFSMLIPKPFDGMGYRSIHMAVMVEELAVGCGGLASTIGVHSAGISCGMVSGDAYILEKYIRPVARAEKRGEPMLWSGAVTEPNAGTDIWEEDFLDKGRIGTHVKKTRAGYVINGKKCFISNGSISSHTIVAAALDPRNVRDSWTLFLVPTSARGFQVGHIERKMGQKASPTAEQIFDDVFVPRECLIGEEGMGARYVSIYLSGSRGPVGAIGTGLARRALECLIDWATISKNARGRLIDQQAIQLAITDMAREIHLARQAYITSALACDFVFGKVLGKLGVKAAMRLVPAFLRKSKLGRKLFQSALVKRYMRSLLLDAADEDRLARLSTLSCIAKIAGSNAGVNISGEVMRMMGHDASDPRWPVEKCYRDAKLTQIYEGTNQANAITQFMGMARGWRQP